MSEVNLNPPILYFLPRGQEWPNGEPPREFKSKGGKGADGPDKKKGQVFSHFPNVEAIYNDHSQAWRKMFGGYYVGFTKGYMPEDFDRERMFIGPLVKLGDDQEWQIPIANPMCETSSLPFVEVRNPETGDWEKEVKEEFRSLSDKALEVAGMFMASARAGEMVWAGGEEEVRGIFCDIISLNYDLTRDEIEALMLMDPRTYSPVMEAFVDWETMCTLAALAAEETNAQNPTGGTPDGNDTASGGKDT